MANRVLCSNGCCLECDDCSKKSGSPLLCEDCLHRRDECFKRHLGDNPEGSTMWKLEEQAQNDGRGPADSRQVGGSHYRDIEGEQHWTRMYRLFGPGYFIGCITKYCERYQKKNGIEDLLKAQHYLDKLLELELSNMTHYPTGDGNPICGAKSGKPAQDPRAVTCKACRKLSKIDSLEETKP